MAQLDADDVRGCHPDLVGFVYADSVERGPADEPYTIDRYHASVHVRPINPYTATPIRSCQHTHRSITAAKRCLRGLLRDESRNRRATTPPALTPALATLAELIDSSVSAGASVAWRNAARDAFDDVRRDTRALQDAIARGYRVQTPPRGG